MKLLPHTHPLIVVWKVFVLLSSLVFLFFASLSLVFEVAHTGWKHALYVALSVAFLLDVLIQSITTAKSGHIILTEPRAVLSHYLKGRFAWDAVAAVPWDAMALLLFPEASDKMIGALMAIRLVKLMNAPRIVRDVQESSNLVPAIMRLIMFSFWLSAGLHVMSVGWILIGGGETYRQPAQRYVRSLYWVVTTVSTIGYGDYAPDHDSDIQIVYTIVLQLLGVGMFSYVIANVSSLVSNLDVARSAHQRKLEEVNAYMRAHRIPPDLQRRVRDYYAYLWASQRGTNEISALDAVPEGLSQEILLFLNKGLLSRVSIFSGAEELFVRESVRLMKPIVFLPDEYVIRQGEFADCMYFLASGRMRVEVDGNVVAYLEAGSPFGEMALVENQYRNATVVSESYGTGYRLGKEDFDALRRKYPAFDRQVEAVIAARRI